MEQILRDVLVRGLVDSEIRLAILQDANQDMSLEQAFKCIEAREAGKRSVSQLLDTNEVAAARNSNYRRSKKLPKQPNNINPSKPSESKDTCDYCGNIGHGKHATPDTRSKKCPAYNTTCNHCATLHHYEAYCRKKLKEARSITSKPNELAANDCLYTDSLCSTEVDTSDNSGH